jgi:voltage-gated potassium channel
MSKPLVSPALAQFLAATAGRNMTKAAYVAVATGVVMMVLLTVDPAYEAAHRWVDAVLWVCLAFFVFEWGSGFASAARMAYVFSGRWVGRRDTASRSSGANPKTAAVGCSGLKVVRHSGQLRKLVPIQALLACW